MTQRTQKPERKLVEGDYDVELVFGTGVAVVEDQEGLHAASNREIKELSAPRHRT